MISKGLIDHGWTYINLDDGWERSAREQDPLFEGPVRAPDGTMLTNKKFPDMKALGDYVHGKGLKFGIYSGPGPTTCQRLEASWQHELQDFQTFANWGVDYLKYDWCGYRSVLAPGETNQQLPVLKRPYQVARAALNQVPRDIIYSLCQYGWGNVWEWGAEKGIEGNSWRTTGDITDTWESMSGIGFRQVRQLEIRRRPGHWNDPDMLVVGKVGWGPRLRTHDSRQRAVHPHHALVAARVAAAHRLRPDADGRLHAQPRHQRRGAGGASGSARESPRIACRERTSSRRGRVRSPTARSRLGSSIATRWT